MKEIGGTEKKLDWTERTMKWRTKEGMVVLKYLKKKIAGVKIKINGHFRVWGIEREIKYLLNKNRCKELIKVLIGKPLLKWNDILLEYKILNLMTTQHKQC